MRASDRSEAETRTRTAGERLLFAPCNNKRYPIGYPFSLQRAIDGRKTSSGRLPCADRSEAETRTRTAGEWLLFAPCNKIGYPIGYPFLLQRAIDGARTRGLDLGKVARYQLRHYRIYYIVVFVLNTMNILPNPRTYVNYFFIFRNHIFFNYTYYILIIHWRSL